MHKYVFFCQQDMGHKQQFPVLQRSVLLIHP